MIEVQGFYDAAHMARRLGVKPTAVLRWADKPTANFPLPVAVLRQDSGKDRPLWAESQLPAMRTWLAARLNLSDPASYWELVDRGGTPPGGHQDQMAMFSVEADTQKTREPDDGLFAAP